MTLELYGWTSALAQSMAEHFSSLRERWEPGRVVRQDRSLLRVATQTASVFAAPAGRLASAAATAEALPVVGDWVAVTRGPGEGVRRILGVLPRFSLLSRKRVGAADLPQPVAANVDRVVVMLALDAPPRVRRLERALAWAWSAGVPPCVALSKVDLCANLDDALAAVQEVAVGTEVVACSALTGLGLDAVRALVAPGAVGLLLGPSGVGKSSLLNALLDSDRLATAPVRPADHKGRHTTSHRELLLAPGGGAWIDGPGVRELGLWGDEGLDGAFEDVLALAASCRYSDCGHGDEPGCAVRAAVEEGQLSSGRLKGFLKLVREQQRLDARDDARAAHRLKQHERERTLAGWSASRRKRR